MEEGAELVARKRGRSCGKAGDLNGEGIAHPHAPLHSGMGQEENSSGID